MSSGYTCGVADGTITEFEEYALICAHAFIIDLRDSSLFDDIPNFIPSNHHLQCLQDYERELKELKTLTLTHREDRANEEYVEETNFYKKMRAERSQKKERYIKMLEKVKLFESPSSDHDSYKQYLVDQLEQSIKWDCGDSVIDKPKELTGKQWYENKRQRLQDDIKYHSKNYDKDVYDTDKTNQWVGQLKEAINDVKEKI